MRSSFVIANWKMHKSIKEAEAFCRDFTVLSRGIKKTTIVVCPPFTALTTVHASLKASNVRLGAQDVFWTEQGAYTGEISPPQLIDAGCRYVLIGHSERRQVIGESNTVINKKLKAVLKNDLIPVLCVGETLQERKSGKAQEVVSQQLNSALEGSHLTAEKMIIAYEPVWAIGTGVNASYQDAYEMAVYIRQCLSNISNKAIADAIPLLYGGSVKADNYAEFLQGGIDGALVGGASLEAASFFDIVRLNENA